MNRYTDNHGNNTAARALLAIGLCGALAACGGGSGGSSTPTTSGASSTVDTTPSIEYAVDSSANTAVIPSSAATAASTTLATAQVVVATGAAGATVTGSTATSTVACPGGGSAMYTVTGSTLANLTNGQLDAGENYSLTFTDCKGYGGAAAVNGAMTLAVTAAPSADNITVTTATDDIVVTLPHGNVTLNGSSTLTQTVTTAGSTVTTTEHWTTPIFNVTTAFNARNSTFAMTDVDITATATVTDGTLVGTTYNGTTTLSANLPNGEFDVTLATQGATSYDATGTPLQGTWTLTLPNNAITLTIANGTATIDVDYGANGSIDATYTYTVGALTADAG